MAGANCPLPYFRMLLFACQRGFGKVAVIMAGIIEHIDSFFITDSEWESKAKLIAPFLSPFGDLVTMFRLFCHWQSLFLDIYYTFDEAIAIVRELSCMPCSSGRASNTSISDSIYEEMTNQARQCATAPELSSIDGIQREPNNVAVDHLQQSWCSAMHVNSRTMQSIQVTAAAYTAQLRSIMKLISSQECDQRGTPSDEDLAKMISFGYFTQLARLSSSSDVSTEAIYSKVEFSSKSKNSNVVLHPNSFLHLRRNAARLVVYSKTLNWQYEILVGLTVVDSTWLSMFPNPVRHQIELDGQSVQSKFSLNNISPSSIKSFFGNNNVNQKYLEYLYSCTMNYDVIRRILEVWCERGDEKKLRDIVETEINALKVKAMNETEECALQGRVRAIYGAGGAVKHLLFGKEFTTISIDNLHATATEDRIKVFCEKNFGNVLDICINRTFAHEGIKSNEILSRFRSRATICFASAVTASQALTRLSGSTLSSAVCTAISSDVVAEESLEALFEPSFKVSCEYLLSNLDEVHANVSKLRGARIAKKCRLFLSWATSVSTKTAFLDFGDYSHANRVLRSLKKYRQDQSMKLCLGSINVQAIALGSRESKPSAISIAPTVDSRGYFIRPEVNEGVEDVNSDRSKTYRVKLFNLSPTVDEVKLRDGIARVIRELEMRENIIYAEAIVFQARVLRESDSTVELTDCHYDENEWLPYDPIEEQFYSQRLQSGELRFENFIPCPEELRKKSPYSDERAHRQGWVLEYHSIAAVRRAYLAWERPPANAKCSVSLAKMQNVHKCHPIRLQYQCTAHIVLDQCLHRGLEAVLRELMQQWMNQYSPGIRIVYESNRFENGTSKVCIQVSGNQYEVWQRCLDSYSKCLTPSEFHARTDMECAILSSSFHCKQIVADMIARSDGKIFVSYYPASANERFHFKNLSFVAIYSTDEDAINMAKQNLESRLSEHVKQMCQVKFVTVKSRHALIIRRFQSDKASNTLSLMGKDVFLWLISNTTNIIDVIATPKGIVKLRQWLKTHNFLSKTIVGISAFTIPIETGNDVTELQFYALHCEVGHVFEESSVYEGNLEIEPMISSNYSNGCLYCYETDIQDCVYYRGCDHFGCRECLKNQFKAASDASIVIPITCYLDGCCLAWSDIKALASADELSALKEVAIGHFLLDSANVGKYRYCPQPRCNHLLRLSDAKYAQIEGESLNCAESNIGGISVLFCELCNEEYCLQCSDRFQKPITAHKGISCEQNFNNPQHLLLPLISFIQEQILTHHCPHTACNAAFIDWDGCCAVKCNRCKNYFCGICFQLFANSLDCHSHVQQCPEHPDRSGSYFVDWDKLQDGPHRQKRIKEIRRYLSECCSGNSLMLHQILNKLDIDLKEHKISENDILPIE